MHANFYLDGPRLLADIGGTNARFALERGKGEIDDVVTFSCADYGEFTHAVQAYLERCASAPIRHAVVAIANPVSGDFIKMTNHHWEFSIDATRRALNFDTMLVVNDFAALAMAVPALEQQQFEQVGRGMARPQGVIGLVGAGTGLGVAGLIPATGRWLTLESEGGHVAFSPSDERELAVLQYCWQRYDHVSAERLVSGPGIALIYQALNAQQATPMEASLDTAAIVARALSGVDALCRETIDCFCGMLGTVAANVAVTLCAKGGIYIGGGIIPRLGDCFATSPFRARFESKGRFSAFNAQIPTFVITAPFPAFLGASTILAEYLENNSSGTYTMISSGIEPRADANLRE
ncbi:MAG TPA: glucokinase [Burkholderiaceae bacterium]|jgi:glucokinase|nr:glucokinase [Burkholderiaceae bacterium]